MIGPPPASSARPSAPPSTASSAASAAVTVVVVAYQSARVLPRCLEALAAQTVRPARVLVVDNASTDGSAALARADGAEVIEAGANLGFAAANNLAARAAQTEWLALLNPDAYPEPDWLEELLAATGRWPRAAAFGSTQRDAAEPARLDGVGDAYFFAGVPFRAGFGRARPVPPEGEVFGPCAAAALWRREAFLALGGFEERFFCYGEDVDLAYRHRLAGGSCVQAPRAVVHHEGSAITGRRSDFTTYHGHRNRVWTYLRDTPPGLLAASLPLHLLLNAYLAARLGLAGQLRAYLRSQRDAWGGARPFLAERRALHAQARPVARALTYSPLALLRRAPKVWNGRRQG